MQVTLASSLLIWVPVIPDVMPRPFIRRCLLVLAELGIGSLRPALPEAAVCSPGGHPCHCGAAVRGGGPYGPQGMLLKGLSRRLESMGLTVAEGKGIGAR